MTERFRGWTKIHTAGPRPTRVCDGSGRMRWGWTCRSKTFPTEVAALALQGPTSARLLRARGGSGHCKLEIFSRDAGKDRRRVKVDISRTGYTGDLGYEVWMPWKDAVKVWDAIFGGGAIV